MVFTMQLYEKTSLSICRIKTNIGSYYDSNDWMR